MSADLPPQIDLESYFVRIEYTGDRTPTLNTLRALHHAHATHIPFENLDVLLGRPILLDLENVQAQLIHAKRGGYCFQQNGLFSAVLEQIGFKVTRLSARVRFGTTRVLPRTHMMLLVEAEGRSWVSDVGFGGWGILEPIPLVADQITQQGSWSFQLRQEGPWWVLQCPQCAMSLDQYAFTLEPHLPVDYELGNHYCSTYPLSRFVQTVIAQRPSLHTRYLLNNRDFITVDAHGQHVETIQTDEQLLHILSEKFGLNFPTGTVFRPRTT